MIPPEQMNAEQLFTLLSSRHDVWILVFDRGYYHVELEVNGRMKKWDRGCNAIRGALMQGYELSVEYAAGRYW